MGALTREELRRITLTFLAFVVLALLLSLVNLYLVRWCVSRYPV